jgi:hypothetical protein
MTWTVKLDFKRLRFVKEYKPAGALRAGGVLVSFFYLIIFVKLKLNYI